MKISEEEIIAALGSFNPWWRGQDVPDIPTWHRASFGELQQWIQSPPVHRAIFLTGARQVGKTTLIMQQIDHLLKKGVPPANILYVTFDYHVFKLGGLEATLAAWRLREPKQDGPEYIFLDEAQFIPEIGTWVKHQVDFSRDRRIVFTGSAMPLLHAGAESGVGRWHNIRLTTLSFYEYIKLRRIDVPPLPSIPSLRRLFEWSDADCRRVSELAQPYIAHFHHYMMVGGFPQTAILDNVSLAQKLIHDDIIGKAINRDMVAIYGVRRIPELERAFLYLCRHDGAQLDMPGLSENLGVARQTVANFIDILEASHLIYKLEPFGGGKQILRARHKVYLSDAAIAPAVMRRGTSILDHPEQMGIAAESVVLKHMVARYYRKNIRFCYWREKNNLEVDLIGDVEGQQIPFEVKYRAQELNAGMIKGMMAFLDRKYAGHGYVVTKSLKDLGRMQGLADDKKIMRIPAALLCYWMGEMELQEHTNTIPSL